MLALPVVVVQKRKKLCGAVESVPSGVKSSLPPGLSRARPFHNWDT
ncbi:hypothetical protein HRbin21_01544 [bacterium HR21]|nr:hypothetical protein HRbin21_01544 [bacterium HR21]